MLLEWLFERANESQKESLVDYQRRMQGGLDAQRQAQQDYIRKQRDGLGLAALREAQQAAGLQAAGARQAQAAMNDGMEALRRQQQANAMKTLTPEEYEALLDKPKLLTNEVDNEQ